LKLTDYGWDERLASSFPQHTADGRVAVRISLQVKGRYLAFTDAGEIPAEPTGRLMYDALTAQDLPVVGDWAEATILDETAPRALIHAVLPRNSLLARKEPGKRAVAQPLAANVDIVLIAVALDQDFSLNRIERYLALSRECGISPVVLLTKADASDDPALKVDEVATRNPGVPVVALSVVNGAGLEELNGFLQPGVTCVVLGSSGGGKSTLVNRLLGEDVLKTREVRLADSKGRHTTVNRQMFVLPSGALMIDTPGMRELQLWGAREGAHQAFSDIEELAAGCRFPDCRHENEPDCAVLEALAEGRIDPARLENFHKLSRELDYLSQRQEEGSARIERAKWKSIHKQAKKIQNR